MELEFWRERWREGRLGFHQQKVNARLRKHWGALALADGARVFVPLCGKSLDLAWLAGQGHAVLGNEISEIACRDFYAEQGLAFHAAPKGARFTRFAGGGVELWCGDFFALRREDLHDVAGVYDRAALIALPTAMRAGYAKHLAAILRSGARALLISITYDEAKMQGPPFSVPEAEVRALFAGGFNITRLAEADGPDTVGNLAERGLDTLSEKVFLLERR